MIGILADTAGSNAITSGVPAIIELFGQIWTLMVANPLLMIFVGGSLVGMTLGIFKKMKKSVR